MAPPRSPPSSTTLLRLTSLLALLVAACAARPNPRRPPPGVTATSSTAAPTAAPVVEPPCERAAAERKRAIELVNAGWIERAQRALDAADARCAADAGKSVVQGPEPRVTFLGDPARELLACAVGDMRASFDLCAGRFEDPDAFAAWWGER